LAGAAIIAAAWRGAATIDARLNQAVILLASYGFLWPICIAMSARLFPLHLRTPLPHHRLLRAALACAVGGVALRLVAPFMVAPLDGSGQLLLAASIAMAVGGLGIFRPRRALPRATPPVHTEPIQIAVLSAYCWLVSTAAFLVLNGLAAFDLPVPTPIGETHAFGAGFVTTLILGVGAALFPGFARRPLRSQRVLWATILAANAAALTRLAPLWLAAHLPARLTNVTLATAGLCGLLALLLAAANLAGRRVRPPTPTG
jgi:uncharacterized protein involved in response to NO